uniref:Peptidase S54 rhomboid domain-containing protein n=1 Tax=Arcella intermedia TaxID=1963864 RepID=A0A6B2LJU8_9EUKA
MVVLYGLGFIDTEKFELIPLNIIPPNLYIWTILTAPFYHNPHQYIHLLVNVMVIYYVTPALEKKWGTYEYLNFVFTVNGLTALYSLLILLLIFACTGKVTILATSVSSFLGCSVALLFAYQHLYPEKEWTFKDTFSFKAKHLPWMVLFVCSSLSILLEHSFAILTVSSGGIGIGWFYLRHFQYLPQHPLNKV